METVGGEDVVALVPIRYDGIDAERHQIELNALGESLQGMARILAVTGNFAATGKYAKQYQAMDVKVLVNEPVANCFRIDAAIEFVKQHQLFSGAAGPVLGALIAWVFSRASGKKDEMKMLKDALDKTLAMQAKNQDQLHATLEKLADSLRPAVRQAVAPVGRTAASMTVAGVYTVDSPTAEAIRSGGEMTVEDERDWVIRISEFDIENSSAKVRLAGDDAKRIKAQITDPLAKMTPNPYVSAMANAVQIQVRAKALMRDGEIDTLFISDIKLG